MAHSRTYRRIRIIVDLCCTSDLAERGVLQAALHLLGSLHGIGDTTAQHRQFPQPLSSSNETEQQHRQLSDTRQEQ